MAAREVIASATATIAPTGNIVTPQQFNDATQRYGAGNEHTVLVDGQGRAWAFGKNDYGQLGLGDSGYGTEKNIPTQIPDVVDVVGAACGEAHTILVDGKGQAWACGNNLNGQLGLGNNTNRYTPQPIPNLNLNPPLVKSAAKRGGGNNNEYYKRKYYKYKMKYINLKSI